MFAQTRNRMKNLTMAPNEYNAQEKLFNKEGKEKFVKGERRSYRKGTYKISLRLNKKKITENYN